MSFSFNLNHSLAVEQLIALKKKRQFKKFTFKGLELEQLIDLPKAELLDFVCARARRRLKRGLKKKPMALMKKLTKAKNAVVGTMDKPAVIKTHLRDMIIVPEMINSTVAVYNGKVFNIVDIKADMVGMYLGEFSITYRFVVATC